MKLDFSQPERWATLVNALTYYRAIKEGADGWSEEDLKEVDELLEELDPDRTF